MTASRYFAELALLPAGWSRNVRVDVDPDGIIAEVAKNTVEAGAVRLSGAMIPGISNAHSHAFQYALAGRLEGAKSGRESFWTWRDGMYELVQRLTPDDVESIASYLYIEMLQAGYTTVGEFHYLHNEPNGAPYATRTEMAERLLHAARGAGIGITLLLVLYRHPDFGEKPVLPAQRRFATNVDDLAAMFAALASQAKGEPRERIGIAPHSLRAVTEAELLDLLAAVGDDPATPVHIHVAEQQREVDACLSYYGSRPVTWLLAKAPVTQSWTLVHATHVKHDEIRVIAERGAVVALCPTTEANLGDGIFPTDALLDSGGRVAIGSDSQVTVDPAEELRLLEYAQRLTQHRRSVLAREGKSVGETLYVRAARDGAQALGVRAGAIEAGCRADIVTLDLEDPALAGCGPQELLDAWIFRGGRGLVNDVIVAGKQLVFAGIHPGHNAASRRYTQTLRRLFPA